jgi:FkbM family methyltransferase
LKKKIETVTLWEYLKNQKKKIVIYGMGNGALKILDACRKYEIEVAGFFASDEFSREQYFCGKKVKKLEEIESEFDAFIIFLAFGVDKKNAIEMIINLSKKHELYAPDLPLFGDILFDYGFFEQNYDKFLEVYNLLEDELSKKVFINTINFKITGKINYLIDCTSEKQEIFENIIKFNENEVFLDLGAYNGDTIKEFIEQTDDKYKQIIAFEPDEKNFKKLKKYLKNNAIKNAHCFKFASWEKQEILFFNDSGGRNSSLVEISQKSVNAIDVDSLKILPSTIKVDVEGAEYQTIIGAKNTILKSNPKLMVSAYHKSEDLFELPLLIKSINKNYKIYLRHHPYIPAWENCFYFV